MAASPPSAPTATCTPRWRACPITTTTTPTRTRTEATRVVVGDGWRELQRGERIAPRVLGPGRLTLLRSQAGPLAGDHDRVEIVVESGTLRIEPIAASVALPGPARTVLELEVTVGDSAHLVLEDAPLVVAEGADVLRVTTLRLGAGASAVVRDLVVLGRAGEGPGRLESLLRIDGPEGAILHDALRIEPGEREAYVALAPSHRAVGTLVALGEGGGERRNRAQAAGDEPARARVAGGALHAGGWLLRASAASAADVVAALAAAAPPVSA